MTSFSGLTDASRALAAQRYALDVTGRNIANANTDGYTRERADLAATGGVSGVPHVYSVASSVAGSVDATGASRLNDPVLDARARTEHGRSSYLDGRATTLNTVQDLVDEPSDNGLSEQLNSFWNAWSGVQNNPGDLPARNTLLSKAGMVSATLHSISQGLGDITTATRQSLSRTVDQINQAAQQVGRLNAEIRIGTATGSIDPTLLDQRDSALRSLAELGGASSQQQSDGTVTVSMGGQTLISGVTVSAVATDASDNVTVGGSAVTLSAGTAKAQSEALTTTLPGYQATLDSVAASLVSTVNSAHSGGYDLNGAAGGAFFSGTTAATINVAITDPKQIAASATGSGTPDLNGSVAGTLAGLGALATGADATYRSFVTSLGSAVQDATQQSALQTSVTASVDSLQASVSGVSYDDEVTNMLSFQRAYQASSRVLTTVDELLDTLINRTGRVGL